MRLLTLKLFVISLFFCQVSHATIVQMQTNYGEIEVNLFDETTPITVANFLAYLEDGAYEDAMVHRLVKNFIMQSGGYQFNEQQLIVTVPERASIQNEPVYSNVRGTIAMAKLGGNPNSATSEWFINLVDNSANLDVQNGGFTVFGQVTESSFTALNAIAQLQLFDFRQNQYDPDFRISIPLDNYSVETFQSGIEPEYANYIKINSITVTNPAVDTASILTPAENILITQLKTDEAGSLPYLLCLALGTLLVRRKAKVA